MGRVVSIQARRNLQRRTKGNATDAASGCECSKASIIWLSRHPNRTVIKAVSSSPVPKRRSGVDICCTLLRRTFDAFVDGLALYAASYLATGFYPVGRLPSDVQSDVSAKERTRG
jgi:hypothetical protein